MKMFRLFEKKENVKMTVYILSLMNTYLERCKGDIVLVKEEPGLENELRRLENLGLGNSENAKLLKTKTKELRNKKENSEFGQKVFEFVKELKFRSPSSYLISFDQFYGVLERYGLAVNKINSYTGIIPQRNINEIQMVRGAIDKDGETCKRVLNLYEINEERDSNSTKNYYFIREVCHRDKDYKKLAEKIKKIISAKGRIIRYQYPYGSYYEASSVNLWDAVIYNDWIGDHETRRPDDISFGITKLDYKDLMIAAPENCFSEKFRVTQVPVDPIVFQYCPYGVIVHSVWGEEADDKVLEEYKTLNQKILEA